MLANGMNGISEPFTYHCHTNLVAMLYCWSIGMSMNSVERSAVTRLQCGAAVEYVVGMSSGEILRGNLMNFLLFSFLRKVGIFVGNLCVWEQFVQRNGLNANPIN